MAEVTERDRLAAEDCVVWHGESSLLVGVDIPTTERNIADAIAEARAEGIELVIERVEYWLRLVSQREQEASDRKQHNYADQLAQAEFWLSDTLNDIRTLLPQTPTPGAEETEGEKE